VSWGRLVANKGFEDVLRAMKLLPGVTLLLGGDGPKRHQLKRLAASLGVHDRVTFAGWSGEPQEVYRALQSAKVFVMNSRSEGGPRIALEAMALGLPVVSTKVGVMPDVLRDGENGIVTNGTPMDIAEKIETLLKYPATSEKLGCEARKVLQKFERRELIRRYADFLKSAAR
jgi:L-malate glycosyltransferase